MNRSAIIGAKCKIFKHGHVILSDVMPSYTHKNDPLGHERSIIDAARTSTNLDSITTKKNSDTSFDVNKDVRLLKYLMKHEHWSPFEQIQLKFHLRLPLFVLNQYIRYRTGSYNVESGRYVVLADEFYEPDEFRYFTQNDKNKQGSSNKIIHSDGIKLFKKNLSTSQEIYHINKKLVDDYTLARELARITNPQNIYTSCLMSINLRNALNLIKQRTHHTAQYESRMYAFAIHALVSKIAPITTKEFLNTHVFSLRIPAEKVTEKTCNGLIFDIDNSIKNQFDEIKSLQNDFKIYTPEIIHKE